MSDVNTIPVGVRPVSRGDANPESETIWHVDHVDEVDDEDDPDDPVDYSARLGWPEDVVPNAELCRTAQARRWADVFAMPRPQQLRALQEEDLFRGRLPLFASKGGEEYQVDLTAPSELPTARCDKVVLPRGDLGAYRFYELVVDQPPDAAPTTPPLPRFVMHLGTLEVVTKSRYPRYRRNPAPLLETTDYGVVVDATDPRMPVWVVAPRRRLQERAEGRGVIEPIPLLPVFDGLLGDLDDYYEAACIFDTLAHWDPTDASWAVPRFRQACDNVRKSCTRVRLATVAHPTQIFDETAGGKSGKSTEDTPNPSLLTTISG